MAIYLGSTEITPDMLSGVDKIYLGSQLVWQAGLPAGTVFNFEYTGAVQSVELPKGKYKLQCWGAQGGTSSSSSNAAGSKGGYSEGILTLASKTTLYVFVGGKGSSGSTSSLVNGGWNGGGASVGLSVYNSGDTYGCTYPACGGGATDIATVTSSMSYSSGRTNRSYASLLSRIIVAGGGSGGAWRYTEITTTEETTTAVPKSASSSYTYKYGSYTYGELTGTTMNNAVGSITISNTGSVAIIATLRSSSAALSSVTISAGSSSTVSVPSGLTWIHFQSYDQGDFTGGKMKFAASWTEYETTTETNKTNSSGYSNQSQQGGGTSGRGQYPGTQSAAGSNGAFGLGANQSSTNYRYCGGGGGGGWYGGGTGQSDSSTSYVNYSGGGSGFVNTSANASYRPSGYTGLQLDSGTTTAGNTSHPSTNGGTETGHSGNGYAKITVID